MTTTYMLSTIAQAHAGDCSADAATWNAICEATGHSPADEEVSVYEVDTFSAAEVALTMPPTDEDGNLEHGAIYAVAEAGRPYGALVWVRDGVVVRL